MAAKTIFFRLRNRAGISRAQAGGNLVSQSYVNSVEQPERNFLPIIYLCHLRRQVGISWEALGEMLDDEFLPYQKLKGLPSPESEEE